MNPIILESLDNDVKRLRLNSGRGNPLTPELIVELNHLMDQLINTPPRALVFDANGALFLVGDLHYPSFKIGLEIE